MKNRGIIIGLAGLLLISFSIVSLSLGGRASSKAGGCRSCSLTARELQLAGAPIPNCLEMVQVELGQSVRFVKPNGDELSGTWEADFGTIGEDGTYIAPQNIAAPGIDRIHFVGTEDPNAPDFSIFVQLMASNDEPVEGSQVLDLDDDLEGAEYTFDQGEEDQGQGQNAVIPISESADDVAIAPTSTVNMSTMTIGSETAYEVPIASTGASVTVAMLADPGAVTGQVGRKCGVFPAPPGGCTDGSQKTVIGPKKFEKKPWKHRSKLFTVSAAISGAVGLSVGTAVTIDYDVREVIAYQYTDYYSCVGGAWEYTGTYICRWFALEYRNFDPPYGKYCVFPPSGHITVQFGPPQCDEYVK